ncbi:hypothetical protein JCM11491_001262 [Sporobolomyces phaffii]
MDPHSADRESRSSANRSPKLSISEPEVTAAPPPPTSHARILSLSLKFSPTPSRELASLLELITASSIPVPVTFGYSKENARTPHILTVSSLGPNPSVLVELDSLDPTCRLAQKWVTVHTPPPMTKAGQKFKNVRSAAAQRAKQRGAQIRVPAVGGGGLLDALIILDAYENSGIELRCDLRLQEEKFTLELQVYVETAKFFPLSFSRAKQLLINRLFPQANQLEAPELATIDFFYSALRRAPLTSHGLPPASRVATTETEEERSTRLRREAKGKGRAIDNPELDRQEGLEGEEDLLLRPQGLKVELLPFQSRSLRWMLAREGKWAKVLRGDELARVLRLEDEEIESRRKTEVKESREKGRKARTGKEKASNEESKSNGDGPEEGGGEEGEERGEEEIRQRIELKELDEATLANMRRGPLWEQVQLELSEGEAPSQIEVWCNRVTGQLSDEDPLKFNAPGQDGTRMKVDQEEENDPEEPDELDGIEGHGLLADEVGTGKTVTTVSLILLHSDHLRRKLPAYHNPDTDAKVQPTGLSLIVCPAAISGQWKEELARLAPELRVLRYDGIKALKPKFTPAFIAKSYDVVLTTFDVLRREVTIARKPHVRALRNQAQREPRYRRSLLIEVNWLRVVADETQMVGDAFGPTSETLSLIPRQFSWAVTSTPLRDKIEDVRPLLTYLRVEPIASSKASLSRLLEEPAAFKRLFEEIGERTLKSQIQTELFLPRQTRLMVPLDFTAVERFYYDSRYSEMLYALGLESDGTPRQQIDRRTGQPVAWLADKAEMNRWLAVLRALTAHPQVGAAGRQALGSVLKTVEEVYTTMREQAISAIQSDQRAILATQVKRGQYLMWEKDAENRFDTALRIFDVVLEKVEPIIEAVAEELLAAFKESRKSRSSSSASPIAAGVAGALQVGFANDEGQDKDTLSDRERAFARSLSSLRNRLRDLLFVKHSALFFSGHAYFNTKQEEKETRLYAEAEKLRQTLLQPYEDHVEKAQTTLVASLDALEVTDLELPFNELGHGIVALSVYEDIEITSDILNGYAELLFTYRTMIIDMILKTVSIAGENATGEEYEERAILQEKLEAYIEAYTVLVGEWCYGILGTRSTLADQFKAEQSGVFFTDENLLPEAPPTRTQKKRQANIKHNSIKDFCVPSLETHTPAQVLRYELLAERIEAKGEDREFSEITPLRHLIKKLKDAAELSSRDAEVALLDREKARIVKVLGPLESMADRLRSELASFTTAFNARLLYFKSLQIISDSVVDPDLDGPNWRGLLVELEALRLQEKDLVAQLEQKEKRKRYLDNLNAPDEEDEHTCPICADNFNDGVLLACVHLVCRSCFKNWYSRSHTCPLCKAPIPERSWTSVKYRHKAKKNVHDEHGRDEDADPVVVEKHQEDLDLQEFEGSSPALAELSQSELDEISLVETVAPLSSKADYVVKLVRWIRRRNPEDKVVVFSAWQDSIALLMEAFNRNGLVFVRLEGSTAKGKREAVVKKFAEDPDVAAFFLHTKSQAAGLTLTSAAHMILLEPLLTPQLEIQATARIWRIGQTKPTTVYNFMIRDTSDQRVAELRARAGTSLFLARGQFDNGQQSAFGQQAKTEATEATSKSKNGTSSEALDDEDDIARCLLSPEHYFNLQKALLHGNAGPHRELAGADADADAVVAAAIADRVDEGGDGGREMRHAGIAAAGRAAFNEL